jgi:branched-subunit amino acid aminotransferase/4-amino-4-deoxychorismate lyase
LESAVVPVNDRGFSHGLGLFETILMLGGRPAFWKAHLKRLRASMNRLGWQQTQLPSLHDAMLLCDVQHHGVDSVRLKINVSGGVGQLAAPSQGTHRSVLMTTAPLAKPAAPLRATLSPWRRNELSPLAGLKSTCYAENLLALEYAAAHDCNELLWLNGRGELCEACTANVFLVLDGVLLTPPLSSGCLPGITRAWVIKNARNLGFRCKETSLTETDLDHADEMFLTNALHGPVALESFRGRSLEASAVASQLHAVWLDDAKSNAPPSRF